MRLTGCNLSVGVLLLAAPRCLLALRPWSCLPLISWKWMACASRLSSGALLPSSTLIGVRGSLPLLSAEALVCVRSWLARATSVVSRRAVSSRYALLTFCASLWNCAGLVVRVICAIARCWWLASRLLCAGRTLLRSIWLMCASSVAASCCTCGIRRLTKLGRACSSDCGLVGALVLALCGLCALGFVCAGLRLGRCFLA